MTRTTRRLLNLANCIMLATILSSCTMPAILPSAKDYEKINSGKRSLVLLRITCEIDGDPYEVFKQADLIGLALGSFRTGGEVRLIMPHHLSSQTRNDGWMYLLLEPGLSYLAVQPPQQGNIWSYENSFKSAPLWRLDIPPQTGIVYTGTLHIPAIRPKGLFNLGVIKSFITDSIVVRNEEDAARKIAAEFLPELQPFKTMLIVKHQGPIILKTPQLSK